MRTTGQGGCSGLIQDVKHVGNRRHADDGLVFGEGPTVGVGTDKFAIDINRATAHTRDGAVFDLAGVGGLAKDDGVLRANEVLHHAQNFERKSLDGRALDGRTPLTFHARFDVAERHGLIRGRGVAGNRRQQPKEGSKDRDAHEGRQMSKNIRRRGKDQPY